MKRFIAIILVFASFGGLWSVRGALAGGGYDYAVVNNPNAADRLNLRQDTDVLSRSMGKYYNGVDVTILAYLSGGWVQARIGDTVGYMQSQYLSINNAGPVTSAIPKVQVQNPRQTDRLNLREMPSEATRSLGKYNNGIQVEVLGVADTWYHVRVDGKIGYMLAKYLSPLGGSSSGGSAQTGDRAVVNNPKASERLHLRTEPKTSATSLGKYYTGVEAQVLAYVSDTWAYVRIGSAEGYMMRQYLSINPRAGSIPSAIPVMQVNNPRSDDRLNLRANPSEKAQSLGRYYNGTQVEVLGVADAWVHVRVGGRMGYMMAKYLR